MMARDWASKTAKDFLRLSNTMRRKRHFFIINLVNFWHFPQDLIVDRLNGLLHMVLKDNGTPGKALYIRQKKLESLWNDYKKLNKRRFFHYKSFRIDFPYIMEDGTFEKLDITIEGKPHCTYNDYEMLKDAAIRRINTTSELPKDTKKLLDLRLRLGRVDWKSLGINAEIIAAKLGIASARLREWRKIDLNNPNLIENEPNSLEKIDFEAQNDNNLNNSGDNIKNFSADEEEDEEDSQENEENEL